MAELQTTYSNTIAHGYAGMVANGETSNRISRTIEDAAGVGFGVPVYRGSGDHGCTAPSARSPPSSVSRSRLPARAGRRPDGGHLCAVRQRTDHPSGAIYVPVKGAVTDGAALTVGAGGGAADLIGATAADATHIATGWIADETVTDGICRCVKR
jgi:hypothetical protein